ncbi:MAG: histidinol dehydrogenase, partial [Rhodanobacteraceae bacterium]
MNIVAASDRARLAGLFRRGWDAPAGVRERVSGIIDDVRRLGDAALIEYTRAFDSPSYDIGMLRVRIPSSAQARSLVPLEIANGLRLARERVASFHARQLREDIAYVDDDGTQYGFAFRPLDSVAAYVPGGTATLPSSVIMTCVPAKIAGVARVAVLTPPQRDGRVSAAVQYACSLCGVDELYADGGAQAIA